MLRIIPTLVEFTARAHALARQIQRHDRDLASQIRRASTSVALNATEGLHAKAGKKTSRLEDAINSAREVSVALRIAARCSYAPEPKIAHELQELDGIIAVLWTLTYKC